MFGRELYTTVKSAGHLEISSTTVRSTILFGAKTISAIMGNLLILLLLCCAPALLLKSHYSQI